MADDAVLADAPQPAPGNEATRERLIQAAIEVFLEKGYGGTRVQDIAARAGFTSGALYVHFSGRSELLAEAIRTEGDEIIAGLIESSRTTNVASGELMRTMTAFITDPATVADRLMVEAFALAVRSDGESDALMPRMNEYLTVLDQLVADAAAQGLIDESFDVRACRDFLLVVVLGSMVGKSLGLFQRDYDSMEPIVANLLRSFATGHPGVPPNPASPG